MPMPAYSRRFSIERYSPFKSLPIVENNRRRSFPRNSDQARYDALKRMFDSEFTNVEKSLKEYGQKLRLSITTGQ